MEILKFCGIFASFAVQIVGRDERTPYFTKKKQKYLRFKRSLYWEYFREKTFLNHGDLLSFLGELSA